MYRRRSRAEYARRRSQRLTRRGRCATTPATSAPQPKRCGESHPHPRASSAGCSGVAVIRANVARGLAKGKTSNAPVSRQRRRSSADRPRCSTSRPRGRSARAGARRANGVARLRGRLGENPADHRGVTALRTQRRIPDPASLTPRLRVAGRAALENGTSRWRSSSQSFSLTARSASRSDRVGTLWKIGF